MSTQHYAALSQETLDSLHSTYPPNKPVYMVNFLRYRSSATYTGNNSLPQVSGREVYQTRYIPSLAPWVLQLGQSQDPASPKAEVVLIGSAKGVLVGPEEKWEDIGIVKYPSLEYFRDMVGSEKYQKESLPHRNAAIEDWRLVAVESFGD